MGTYADKIIELGKLLNINFDENKHKVANELLILALDLRE